MTLSNAKFHKRRIAWVDREPRGKYILGYFTNVKLRFEYVFHHILLPSWYTFILTATTTSSEAFVTTIRHFT